MEYGNQITQDTNSSNSVSKITGGYTFDNIWSGLLLIELIISIPILILTHSINLVGAYLFSTVFWTSYTGAVSVLLSAGFLATSAMIAFTGIFTVIIGLIFIGALIGMFTGNG